jgi:hypothetical protein
MTDILYFGCEYQQHVALQARSRWTACDGRRWTSSSLTVGSCLPTPNLSVADSDAVVAQALKFVQDMKGANATSPSRRH